MFGKNATIIYISKKLIAVAVSGVDLADQYNLLKYEWTENTLHKIFDDLAAKTNMQRVHVLLGEDISYCARVSIEVNEEYDSDATSRQIKDEMLKVFPEHEKNLVWDHKKIYKIDEVTYFQVVGVPKALLSMMLEHLSRLNAHVLSIEPIAYSIARLTTVEEGVHVVICANSLENFFILADKGSVLMTQSFETANFAGSFYSFVKYIRGAYSLPKELKMIVPKEVEPNLNAQSLREMGIVMESADLNPFISIKNMGEVRGKDEDVLSLPTQNVNKDDLAYDNMPSVQNQEFIKKLLSSKLTYMVIVLIIMIIMAGYVVLNYLNQKGEAKVEVEESTLAVEIETETEQPTEEVVAEPEFEPEPEVIINYSDYSINILNGSGIAGEAGRVSDVVSELGFTSISTGNAEEFDYEVTTVKTKSNLKDTDIPEDILLSLSDYNVSLSSEDLPDSYLYDVEIIVSAPAE